MTLLDIETDVLSRLNYDITNVNAAVKARIDRFINQRYRQVLAMPGMAKLRDASTTFPTVASTAQYTLSANVQRINAIYDATNQRRLTMRSLDWLRSVDPGLVSTSSVAEAWVPVTETATHAWTVQIWPTPSAVVTLSVDYTANLTELSGSTDEPLLPPDFHYLLSVGARLDEYEKLQDARYPIVAADWQRGVARLLNFVQNPQDFIAVPGSRPVAWSSLGPWYPAGS